MSKQFSEADHVVLMDQLDAYIDGELGREAVYRIDAHLIVCARCHRVMVLHRTLRTQLARESFAQGAEPLRVRIQKKIATVKMPPAVYGRSIKTWGGWAFAASLMLAWGLQLFWHGRADVNPIPMVQAAVADFNAHMAAPLPRVDLVALRSRIPFPVKPLSAIEGQLVAAWRVTIRGEPVAALAYRVGNQIVVQYVVSQHLFLEQAVVRNAIAQKGRYLTQAHSVNVLGWSQDSGGTLLVGEVKPDVLKSLQM